MYPQIGNAGKLVTIDKEKAELLNNFICLSLQWQLFFPTPLESVGLHDGDWG